MSEIVRTLFTTKAGYKKLMLDKTGWLVAIVISFFATTYYQSFDVPITVEYTKSDLQVIKEGSSILVCRDIRYHRNATSILMRSFIKSNNPDKGDVVAGLTSVINRDANLYKICREEPLSSLVKEGEWTVETKLQYTGEYGIWTHVIDLEDIPIKVVKEIK